MGRILTSKLSVYPPWKKEESKLFYSKSDLQQPPASGQSCSRPQWSIWTSRHCCPGWTSAVWQRKNLVRISYINTLTPWQRWYFILYILWSHGSCMCEIKKSGWIVNPCCSWVEKILTKNLPWEFLIDIFFSKNRVHDTCHQQRQPLWRSPHSAWSYASAQIQTSEYLVWKNMLLSQTRTSSSDTQHKANFYVFR